MLDKILVKEVMAPIVIIIIALIVYAIARAVLNKIVKFQIKSIDSKRQTTLLVLFNNIVKIFVFVISAIAILDIYGIDTKSILASLGVFTAVSAFALQDLFKDFISGISIIIEGTIRMGDTVTISGFQGEVISMTFKSTKIKSFSGEIKIFSNRNIVDVVNHTLGNSLAIVDITVSHESDLKVAEKVLEKLCASISNTIPEMKGPLKLEGIVSVAASGIVFRLSADTVPMKQFKVQRAVLKEVIYAMREKDINIR